MDPSANHFPTETTGLPEARSTQVFELADRDQFDLRIAPTAKRLGDAVVRMLAYNGSIPGPTLRVQQGSAVTVNVVNGGDLEATVHWHGLRVENRYDGTAETQRPIPVGGRFTYRLTFPDPGIYWYHPHIREDYAQEMGLYGNILVVPSESDYWPPVNRELTLTLDDILLEDGRIAPFSRSHPNYTAMGRFGNLLLVNGEPELSLRAWHGQVVRFYLTNTANTRVFNVGLRGARMKLVGGDSGHCEREAFVDGVLIAPSERVVVDALFDQPGQVTLEHRTPSRSYPLATITVGDARAEPSLTSPFGSLRTNSDMAAERERIATYLGAEPDKTLALVAEMNMGEPERRSGATVAYVCPMHAEVISHEPGRCPTCGMKLMATEAAPLAYACPMHPDVTSAEPDRCPKCGMKLVPSQLVGKAGHGQQDHTHAHTEADDHPRQHAGEHADQPMGIEWEDDMLRAQRLEHDGGQRVHLAVPERRAAAVQTTVPPAIIKSVAASTDRVTRRPM